MIKQFYFGVDPAAPVISGLYAGLQICPPGHHWEGVRTHYLFHLVVSGQGRVWSKDSAHDLEAGDGFMIYPGDNVHYQASRENPWSYTWLGFTGTHVDDLLREGGITKKDFVVRGLPLPETSDILNELIQLFPEKKPGHHARVTGLAYRFLAAILKDRSHPDLKVPGLKRKKEYVQRVKDFIQIHYGKEISATQIADSLGLDRSYLSTLFKRETGESLSDLLIRIRMEKARELLRAGKLSVSEISFSVGYGDLFAFSKRFKKVTGKTPKEFRLKG